MAISEITEEQLSHFSNKEEVIALLEDLDADNIKVIEPNNLC